MSELLKQVIHALRIEIQGDAAGLTDYQGVWIGRIAARLRTIIEAHTQAASSCGVDGHRKIDCSWPNERLIDDSRSPDGKSLIGGDLEDMVCSVCEREQAMVAAAYHNIASSHGRRIFRCECGYKWPSGDTSREAWRVHIRTLVTSIAQHREIVSSK